MTTKKKLLEAAAGNAGEAVYVDDVFSTYLYTGNGSTQTITNGIDLDGEGGLVWIKNRDQADSHILTDTERGATKNLFSDSYVVEATDADTLTAFNSDGFVIGDDVKVNTNTEDYASWTFRKQPGFFDVVTWTGTGSGSITVSHNLGSVPGTILVKATNAEQEWFVYHRSLGATKFLHLSTIGAAQTQTNAWNDTEPTSTEFTGGSYLDQNGRTYVAYLFAHDAQDFGTDSDESIIKCGSYTGNGSTNAGPEIDLGWEPQWLLIKCSSNAEDWVLFDASRNLPSVTHGTESDDTYLKPNDSDPDQSNSLVNVLSNGFRPTGSNSKTNSSGLSYIYVAIRRPQKPASHDDLSVSDMYKAITWTGDATASYLNYGFDVDLFYGIWRNQNYGSVWQTRLAGNTYFDPKSDNGYRTNQLVDLNKKSRNVYTDQPVNAGLLFENIGDTHVGYGFKRTPEFFDVVTYLGGQSAGSTVKHGLTVAPEFMIVKNWTSDGTSFVVKHSGLTGGMSGDYFCYLNASTAQDDGGSNFRFNPSSTEFTLSSTNAQINDSITSPIRTYVAYLFATVPGISKVGSYTGTGSNVDVDCGFTGGAGFVLIKRADSTGDWYFWDNVRGIVAGNDPYLNINVYSTEVTNTDYIDPLSSGFTITSSAPAALNASGGNYIFLAIA